MPASRPGTAGKPILNAIEVRGPVRAGRRRRPLVRRHQARHRRPLPRVPRHRGVRRCGSRHRSTATSTRRFEVTVPFDAFGTIYRLIDPPHVVLVEERFGETNIFAFDVRASRAEDVREGPDRANGSRSLSSVCVAPAILPASRSVAGRIARRHTDEILTALLLHDGRSRDAVAGAASGGQDHTASTRFHTGMSKGRLRMTERV